MTSARESGTRLNRVLGVVLVLQVALAAGLWWPEDPSARAPRALLAIEQEAIREVRIVRGPEGEAETEGLHLAKTESGWQIASAGGYPAAQERVDSLLESLLGLAVRDPIATQATSYDSLHVGAVEFGKRVVVSTADGDTTLWLGAATSDSVHVRSSDAPEVYTARGISEWSLGDAASGYADPNLVSVDVGAISAFTLRNASGTLSFVRDESGWSLEGSEAPVDSGRVTEFLAAVTRVRIAEPVGREAEPGWSLADGARIDWMEVAEEQSVAGGYAVASEEDAEGRSYVQAVASRLVARASTAGFERLRSATAEEFVRSEVPSEAEGDAAH